MLKGIANGKQNCVPQGHCRHKRRNINFEISHTLKLIDTAKPQKVKQPNQCEPVTKLSREEHAGDASGQKACQGSSIKAFTPRVARSERLSRASAPIPPICMPIDMKLAKPHRAKVERKTDRGAQARLFHSGEFDASKEFRGEYLDSDQLPHPESFISVHPINQAMGANITPEDGFQAQPVELPSTHFADPSVQVVRPEPRHVSDPPRISLTNMMTA